MSGPKDYATLGAFAVLVAGAVWLSGTLDRKPQVTEAAAAAIAAELDIYVEQLSGPPAGEADSATHLTVCLETARQLDFPLLAKRLAPSFLRPVPAAGCTKRTVEGDFGMFTARTYWFDAQGTEAAHLKIAKVDCPTRSRCLVDIDWFGGGNRYEVERSGGSWSVTGYEMRWVV
ncbi:hypothetical protein OIK40_02455 [Erythrobacter sp. sf7]|uniref:Uncharacterized protein n=1 Tax=Erythrobacter fulvus TaxID=2987523 RepID=A0ABT5JLV8_9SPHN|nr:hypothetical protein [Erythrobacter fulvus]MDC8753501.1 hypothetical protein [Erythrobacter fulvus]